MNPRISILVMLALAMGLFGSATLAQKPPAPPPPPAAPPRTPSNQPPIGTPLITTPGEPSEDLVMFLQGHVATDDGTPVPHDALIERVCDARVRQQVYASSHGDFTMELGARTDSYPDDSRDRSPQNGQTNNLPGMGISRLALLNCELRATASGFRSGDVSLVDLTPQTRTIDVGAIVVRRATKIKGATVSAASYQTPKDARRAYEKGLDAAKNGRLADARQYFEKAVEIYPKFANAWFQLGVVLQNLAQKESARTAYTHATAVDTKFLPPYLSLASMAYEAQDWPLVLNLTNHVLDLDPMKYANITGYILDLDPLDYAKAYFYNSAANFNLNKLEDAEKSGLKAERLDVRPHFPRLHLLLAEIFARKHNYVTAISEIKMYLELVPQDNDADQVRDRLATLEKLNNPAPSTGNTNQK